MLRLSAPDLNMAKVRAYVHVSAYNRLYYESMKMLDVRTKLRFAKCDYFDANMRINTGKGGYSSRKYDSRYHMKHDLVRRLAAKSS